MISLDHDDDRESEMERMRGFPLLLTDLQHSTLSATVIFTNVKFIESEWKDLECYGPIRRIVSNYIDVVHPDYGPMIKKKKSNRGRKKKERKTKTRKVQGTGTAFNSQIQFVVEGTHTNDEGEEITKAYKLLVFRNGKTTITGVLTEDMRDSIGPIETVRAYLSNMLHGDDDTVQIASALPSMRNYKCVLNRQIDIFKLQTYFINSCDALINTNFDRIREYLTSYLDPMMTEIDWKAMEQFLRTSPPPLNLYTSMDHLKATLIDNNLLVRYKKLKRKMDKIAEAKEMDIEDDTLELLWRYNISGVLADLCTHLEANKDNNLSRFTLDTEKNASLIARARTPLDNDPEKCTTIKLFRSGKINIDGANNRHEATFIYLWLNQLFNENPNLIYSLDDSTDPDEDIFSYTDSDADEYEDVAEEYEDEAAEEAEAAEEEYEDDVDVDVAEAGKEEDPYQ